MQIKMTVFDDVNALQRRERVVHWDDLARELMSPPQYASKAAMPLLKLATFGDHRSAQGSVRWDANVREVHGIEGDYDTEVTSVERAHDILTRAGVEALLYTTARNEPGKPRWRVLCPLSTPCVPHDRRAYVGILNEILGGVLADESFTLSQSFYYGAVSGCEFKALRSSGRCIDDFSLLYDGVFPTEDRHEANAEDIDAAVRALAFANVTDETMLDIRSAVAALRPHRYEQGSYLKWFEIILALNSLRFANREAEARNIAIEFSRRGGAAFDPRAFDRLWREVPKRYTYRTIFKRAAEDGWANPRASATQPDRADGGRVDHTDSGNVNALYEETKGDLRYVVERKVWLWWTGCGWQVDESGSRARDAALKVAERYWTAAATLEKDADRLDGEERKHAQKLARAVRSWALHCRNKKGLDNMLALAARDSRFAVSATELDLDVWALGVANGVVDLRTGVLRANSRENFITKSCNCRFDPDAGAPAWRDFIAKITGLPDGPNCFIPRPELASYAQRAIGYWATGSTREQKMFVAVGDGSNGKSVMFDVIEHILGPYCVQVPPDAMMASSRDADAERPTPVARSLAGARLAFGSEAKERHKLNAAWVKKQTGDGKMTARGMHENTFTFSITHKLALLTNHEPQLDHMDEATRGRIHTWPFDRRWNRPGLSRRDPNLPDGDKDLKEKLLAEGEGILAWIVAGAVLYCREGLEPPAPVAERTVAYFDQQDALVQWLATTEKCALAEGTRANELFESYKSWCGVEGFTPTPSNVASFGKRLKSTGCEYERDKAGSVYGLRVGTPTF
ncbi:hypothetical protein EZ313_19625 [Ramlibacter henchirensis]|uniref:SF3 helicase domain-containing protein n=1 Tax=Ramlibacter henchirensis TaxID=204072 RepID=A0A4Z0BMY8_9BURK|nr:phage/plasmid primase, P4 family [Ramlibacter henchirensis]TFZ00663.1 hypothetical protein EZ313_19625 [Ramlibacter henchirensis]